MPMPNFGNPYFQNAYNPYLQQAFQQFQQQAMPQNGLQVQQQAQNGGFIRVQSEMQAKEYPVALGNSVTFIDENAPFCYTKSMPLSQLEPPVFKKFKLVEVNLNEPPQNAPQMPSESQSIDLSAYALKSDIEAIQAVFGRMQKEIDDLKNIKSALYKKEVIEDEQ